MKLVVDDRISNLKGILEPVAEVSYMAGASISRKDVIDADALIVRTRTKVDRNLLEGTRVRFIGTATIGADHIDTEWCREKGIHCVSAPGSNSGSVMQYMASALAELQLNHKLKSNRTTLGIIGVGNIGNKVKFLAETLGFKVLLNDPPREKKEGSEIFTPLNLLLKESDIISVHVPLTREGSYPTFNLLDSSAFEKARSGIIIINTSRGGIVDEKQLILNLKKGEVRSCITDVWENEPDINRELLEHSLIATPHIAGYSADGKLNAASQILDEFSRFFKFQKGTVCNIRLPYPGNMEINIDDFSGSGMDKINRIILYTYPIISDHNNLFACPEKFEALRNNYGVRREFHNYTISGTDNETITILSKLGFKTKNRTER